VLAVEVWLRRQLHQQTVEILQVQGLSRQTLEGYQVLRVEKVFIH
jgi:hypothetical protein